ncbi:Thoeris anti-defense Tad2 family protein [Sinorhizobium meliloti]|uniref:Thoeris anti-defense Tad2 family protein n=1 Tax=Rhizobium meliloti TaxID=382 RepID=UPI001912A1AE|nr:DUF2829 domain-containing protein [Sinorhizobium meliloti]
MNYGQAIEAMKRGGFVIRPQNTRRKIRLAHIGTPLQYFEVVSDDERQPYVPTTDDQLADDWFEVISASNLIAAIEEAWGLAA